MNEILTSIYEKYFESINTFLQTFSSNGWILIGLTFIGFVIKLPILLLIPLSYGSYLAVENETLHDIISKNATVSPELIVLSTWVVCIFLRIFTFKQNNNQENSGLIKNVLSFALIFVLTIVIGTPAFESSIFKEFKFIIMLGIFLYALFHIFKHSIGLLKNVFVTFAWILIITILGIQHNPEYVKNIFKTDDAKSIADIKYELKKSLEKHISLETHNNIQIFTKNNI